MGKDTRNFFVDKSFPNSLLEPFKITSPETASYNCLAWALNDTSKWYENDDDYYWFEGIEKNNTLETIQKIFVNFGFIKTENTEYQVGIERIALFSKDNIECTHLARQQDKDQWTSKLGSSYDVNHTLKSIENGIYGNVVIIMEKRLTVYKKLIKN
jgi:hypothetical protein